MPDPSLAALGDTARVSVASDGTQADAGSGDRASVSADGRYVAFDSAASNLVADDTNFTYAGAGRDIFVHDRQTQVTERVSVASDGTESNHNSAYPSISADGRYVAFTSEASNLVVGDTNETSDVFVHDRQTKTTERVSVASDGTQAYSHPGDPPSISADGRYVAFSSAASNLVAGDTNGWLDVFVHDRQTRTTERVSVASDGTQTSFWASQRPSISADGRYVAFDSGASNLVAGDTNGAHDVFVHDRLLAATERVSLASGGAQGNGASVSPSISANGRYVSFGSGASNLAAGDTNGAHDIFVRDRDTAATERVSAAGDGSQANGASASASISADGRYVAFDSGASNLVAGDTNGANDVFVHDRQTAATARVSVASDATEGNSTSVSPSISANGRYVAFNSWASNLVAGDTNGATDIFVHDFLGGVYHALSVTKDGTGSGTVASDPSGIDCGSTCSAEFEEGSSVTLTATPDAGSAFSGWGGACSGTGTCTVTMDSPKSVTATFTPEGTHDVGVAGGGFRTKGHIDISRNGPGPFDVKIKVKNFGDGTVDILYDVSAAPAEVQFSGQCSGTAPAVAPGKAASATGCTATYVGTESAPDPSTDPDPVLTLTVTGAWGSDVDPGNNSKSQAIVINP